jgi:AraC-like DNA-binding protein
VNLEYNGSPLVELLGPIDHFERDIRNIIVLYVLQGVLQISDATNNHTLAEGDTMLFPPGVTVTGQTDGVAKVMIMRVRDDLKMCDEYSLEDLYSNRDMAAIKHTPLNTGPMLRMQMELLADNVEKGLLCSHFLEMKIKEFFFYLRAFCTDDELARFNMPLLSSDSRFMFFVWQNYRKAHNVSHFAEMSNRSSTAFKRKFKKVTGMTPSEWLSQQKARNVYHEIRCGRKSLKEISHEYHFASVSHLGTFCRKNFMAAPGQITRHNENRSQRQAARQPARQPEAVI